MERLNLIIYSTSHCHLCEQAEALLEYLSDKYSIAWVNIEIAEDDELLEHYGMIIPVLKRTDKNTELLWPFTIEDIEQLLSDNQQTECCKNEKAS